MVVAKDFPSPMPVLQRNGKTRNATTAKKGSQTSWFLCAQNELEAKQDYASNENNMKKRIRNRFVKKETRIVYI